jgi:hypothetical protein
MRIKSYYQFIAQLSFLTILFGINPGICLSDEADSLKIYGHQGLDEVGGGSIFNLQFDQGAIQTNWQGRFEALYRTPANSQGDYRSSGDFQGKILKTINDKIDVFGLIHGDIYRYLNYSGPGLFPRSLAPVPTYLWSNGNPSFSNSLYQKIDRYRLGIGGNYRPLKPLQITLTLGNQWEDRGLPVNAGPSCALSAAVADWEIQGFKNDVSLLLQREYLGARVDQESKVAIGVEKRFTEQSDDRLIAYYRQKSHDYPIAYTYSIGKRLDVEQNLLNTLNYDVNPRWKLTMLTQITGSTHQDRTPQVEVTRKEINTGNSFTLRTSGDARKAWSTMAFEWGVQQDATGLKRERGTAVEGGAVFDVFQADTLSFQAAVRKRQYDTSDTSNYDDRDRLRYEFDLRYFHRITPYFTVSQRFLATLEHLVYIYAEKSDQNHWNRIFKLAPEVWCQPHRRLTNLSRFELIANSNDYDFELDPVLIKSTIYRRYSANDSLSWQAGYGWLISAEYTLDLEDGGRFLWDQWIQQKSDEYRTQQFTCGFRRQTLQNIILAAGVMLYERKGWQFTYESGSGSQRTPFLYLSRWGPVLQLIYPSKSGLRFEMNGDFSWVHEWYREDYTIVNLDLRMVWR